MLKIIIPTLRTISQQHQKKWGVVASSLDGFQRKYARWRKRKASLERSPTVQSHLHSSLIMKKLQLWGGDSGCQKCSKMRGRMWPWTQKENSVSWWGFQFWKTLALEGTEQRAYGIHLRYFLQLQGNLQLAPNIKLQKCNKNLLSTVNTCHLRFEYYKKGCFILYRYTKPQETRGKEDSIQSKTISSSFKKWICCLL